MNYVLLAAIIIIALSWVLSDYGKKTQKEKFDYSNSYQSKPLLSNHEKDAFRKLKPATDKLGLFLFTKVRLYDLIEPKNGCKNFKGAQWKIQAKHVDFVICNQKLDAKLIIELDDRSHERQDRKDRDSFVDTVLKNNGYKILHLWSIPMNIEETISTTIEERSIKVVGI